MNCSDAEPVVLGLGSNAVFREMQPWDILEKACDSLSGVLSDMRKSSVYRTKPMYLTGQSDFFNMVVAGYYGGTPEDLLENIHIIENAFGRRRAEEIRNGPRSLDIDIEFFGTRVTASPDLTIPHPRFKERAFVLVPLLEILPEYAEPLTGTPCVELLSHLSAEEVRYVTDGIQSGRKRL